MSSLSCRTGSAAHRGGVAALGTPVPRCIRFLSRRWCCQLLAPGSGHGALWHCTFCCITGHSPGPHVNSSELDLLAERGSQSQGAHCAVGELAGRRAALEALVAGGQSRLELPLSLGSVATDDGFDRVVDKTFTEEVGIFERISSTLRDVTYNRPEVSHQTGAEAIAFIDNLFSLFGPSASAPFPLLYELFTSTMSLQVVPGDDFLTVASILLRLCCRDGSKSAGVSVLRTIELNPQAWAMGCPPGGLQVVEGFFWCMSVCLGKAAPELNNS
ncbi:unnamed protein product [Symbiodinium sp. CCMP2592]|nr:unnamed protein product [Symbiodinium sp. CCMP2592]